MSTVSKPGTPRPLDPANAGLDGQARVNAEIFTAVEILGRKLERSEAERERLTRRLALIESAATVDEKTGKLYLPAIVDQEMVQRMDGYATPKWMVAASLMSSAIALFALGLVLFREPAPLLTKEQLAALDTLKGPQFASLAPESRGWKSPEMEAAPQENTETASAEVVTPVAEPQIAIEPAAGEPPAPEQPTVAEVVPTVPTPAPEEAPKVAEVAPPVPPAAEPQISALAEPKVVPAEESKMPDTAALTKLEKTAEAPVIPAPVAGPPPEVAPQPEPPKVVEKKPAPEKPVVAKAEPAPTLKSTPAPEPAPPQDITATVDAPMDAPAADPALPAKMSQLEKRAYEGVPEAQHDLATLYASGKLVAQDYPRALYWFTKSADGGVANSHYNLGVIYQQGLGVAADMTKALGWYEKAAELGHPEAMYNLGIAYIEGIGTTANIEKGVSFFKRAAKAGVAQAAYNLGVLYESNFIGAIDTAKAIEWYQVAANEGHAEAREAIVRMKGGPISLAGDQALSLADIVEPAAGGETGEGDSSPAEDSGHAATQKDLLIQIQKGLIRLKLLPAPADGMMTPQTQDAIRAYQKRQSWPEDGEPSQKLLDRVLSDSPAK